MAETIDVHLACNDPQTGRFADAVWAVEFHTADHSVSVAGGALPEEGLRLVIRPGEIVIAGECFGCNGSQPGIGNWCWESFDMPLETARQLLRSLLLERWSIDEYDDGSPFADLIAAHESKEVRHG